MNDGAVRVEVCLDSVASARTAERAGVHRIELCANLLEGGTTPSAGLISSVRRAVSIPLFVMIRPRGGDFLYDEDEREGMRYDILAAKQLGANGVVLGALRADGNVDIELTAAMIDAARPMQVTFHRAIDMSREPSEALEALIALGVERVLTSGQAGSALEGVERVGDLVRQAAGRITVMPGGGIERRSIRLILERSGAREVHVAPTETLKSTMQHRNLRCFMGARRGTVEYEREVLSERLLREMLSEVGTLQAGL